tara:strand:- start:576 stop:794 length:219 start_codon:yes stop_codon:yes gene_type:complete
LKALYIYFGEFYINFKKLSSTGLCISHHPRCYTGDVYDVVVETAVIFNKIFVPNAWRFLLPTGCSCGFEASF